MKKKNSSLVIILFLMIVLTILCYFYFNKDAFVEETSEEISTYTVGLGTIEQKVFGVGEVKESGTEKLELNEYRKFKKIYVKENSLVKKGENILQYTNGDFLTAPYDLVIKTIIVPEEGKWCYDSHYIEVLNIEKLSLKVNIDETEINKIKIGDKVNITLNALDNRKFTGTVSSINEVGNYNTNGTKFEIEISLENDGTIKVGMSANCDIKIKEAKDVIIIPIETVQLDGKEKYVMVLKDDGNIEKLKIETGLSNEAFVEVKTGLKGNEKICIPDLKK